MLAVTMSYEMRFARTGGSGFRKFVQAKKTRVKLPANAFD